ncbi:MAG: hypothetical protein HY801_14445 [Candidatus Lindowbacteria bacterium]|nr:hypothetical protein [Candidatus Lindowbacteria bacterium]
MRFIIGLLVILLCVVAWGGGAGKPTPAVAVEGGQIQGVFEARRLE